MSRKKTAWKPVEFRAGADGVSDAGRFRDKCEGSPKFVASCLSQYQMWRKGEGEYEFGNDPSKNAPPPLCPKALTIVEETAIQMLLEHERTKRKSMQ